MTYNSYFIRFKDHEEAHDTRDSLKDDGIFATFPPEKQPDIENGDWVLIIKDSDIDKSVLSIGEFVNKYMKITEYGTVIALGRDLVEDN